MTETIGENGAQVRFICQGVVEFFFFTVSKRTETASVAVPHQIHFFVAPPKLYARAQLGAAAATHMHTCMHARMQVWMHACTCR